MSNILVTGGQGFIATNLIFELRSRGHEVIPCDILHSSNPQFIRCDVGKYRHLERISEKFDIDFVYHAAAEYGRWNGEDHYENLWQGLQQVYEWMLTNRENIINSLGPTAGLW